MNQKRYEKVCELFTRARQASTEARGPLLDQACADDPDLRREVESLLAADADSLQLSSLAGLDVRQVADLQAQRVDATETGGAKAEQVGSDGGPADQPRHIGPYKILQELGRGGMGVVYLAEQTEPIRRRVALKLIKLGMDTKAVIARFEAERQALALMNHPNVAMVFDAGATEQGRPYFVMEHVAGVRITEHCDRHKLSIADRLELFSQACEAIQHAHQKAVIHRDIKPSNVLVSIKEGKAVVKVIDFGVAKAISQPLTEKTLFTEQGQIIGTPDYMSPEQAEMTAQDIDTRSDIYSLGVLLYELLAGALPFNPESLRAAGFAEIQRIIREVDPPKPSTRLSTLGTETRPSGSGITGAVGGVKSLGHGRLSVQDIARNRRVDPRSLTRRLRGDLDWITMKALEKDRARRYSTATDFAVDISRYLHNEPVSAGPPSTAYRVKKFMQRNRGFVVGTTLLLVVLVGAAAVSTSLYLVAEKERVDAERAVEALLVAARDSVRRDIDRWEIGAALFEAVLEINPDHYRALGNFAIIKKDQFLQQPYRGGDVRLLAKANTLADRALRVNPTHAGLWNVQAVVLYLLDRLDEADEACRRALELDPKYYSAAANRARVLALQRNLDQALESARDAVAKAGTEAGDAWCAGPWYTYATLQLMSNDSNALQSLKNAIACKTFSPGARLIRARARLQLEGFIDVEQALRDAMIADKAVPVADPRFKRVLALAHLRNAHYDEAVQFARDAIRLGGMKTPNHLIIAIAEAKAGNLKNARSHLADAQTCWPDGLSHPADYIVNSNMGILWFDTADELMALRDDATESLQAAVP